MEAAGAADNALSNYRKGCLVVEEDVAHRHGFIDGDAFRGGLVCKGNGVTGHEDGRVGLVIKVGCGEVPGAVAAARPFNGRRQAGREDFQSQCAVGDGQGVGNTLKSKHLEAVGSSVGGAGEMNQRHDANG